MFISNSFFNSGGKPTIEAHLITGGLITISLIAASFLALAILSNSYCQIPYFFHDCLSKRIMIPLASVAVLSGVAGLASLRFIHCHKPKKNEHPEIPNPSPPPNNIVLIQEPSFKIAGRNQVDSQQRMAYEALNTLREALKGVESLPISEDILCEHLSHLFLNLANKRFVILSMDFGGFGDFSFGFKVLNILDKCFPGIHAAFASDNPTKALKVNANDHTVLMPSSGHQGKMELSKVADVIASFAPEFLIVAPVTHIDRAPLQPFTSKIPSLFIREYGFDSRTVPLLPNDYVSGAGDKNWKGMLIHQGLVDWADSDASQNRLIRLTNLQFLPSVLVQAILGKAYSEEAIYSFSQNSELFLSYGDEVSKAEFILAILKMHQKLGLQQINPCFVLLGKSEDTLELLKDRLLHLDIGVLEWVNLEKDELPIVMKISDRSEKKLKLITIGLLPEDVIHMIKSSENEVLTTGDQSWGEGISGKKHWVQAFTIHKQNSVQGVIQLTNELPHKNRGDFFTKLSEAHQRRNVFEISQKRVSAQSDLFYLARINKDFAHMWKSLNDKICRDYIIDPWLKGMIIKKYLEQFPEMNERMKSLMSQPTVSTDALLNFLQDAQNQYSN